MPQAIAHPDTCRELLFRKDIEAQFNPFHEAEFGPFCSSICWRIKSKFSVDFALLFLQNQSINNIAI